MPSTLITSEQLQKLSTNQLVLEKLALEVEKVLVYYQDHPQYPLDYEKLRKKVSEVSAKINTINSVLIALRQSSAKDE